MGILVFGEQRCTEMHGALQVSGGRALEVAADALTMKGTASLGEMGDATWSAKKQP